MFCEIVIINCIFKNFRKMSDDQKIEYLCQRCQQALRLDPSLINIDEHTLAELALPISPAPDLRILAQVRSDPELKVWKFKAEKKLFNLF